MVHRRSSWQTPIAIPRVFLQAIGQWRQVKLPVASSRKTPKLANVLNSRYSDGAWVPVGTANSSAVIGWSANEIGEANCAVTNKDCVSTWPLSICAIARDGRSVFHDEKSPCAGGRAKKRRRRPASFLQSQTLVTSDRRTRHEQTDMPAIVRHGGPAVVSYTRTLRPTVYSPRANCPN